jgi:HNH endonuclease
VSKSPKLDRLREQVAGDARHRCGYCLTSETVVGQILELEHMRPKALGGPTVRGNLWLACGMCNKRKGQRVRVQDPITKKMVRLFNPRRDDWYDHFRWKLGGALIEGITNIGRAMVVALELNLPIRVTARKRWISVGWHPPAE